MTTHLVLLFLILSVLGIPVYPQPIRQVSGFKLALQWPNSYCNGIPNCEPPVPQKLTIHGCWPRDFHGDVMTNVDHSTEDYMEGVAGDVKRELSEHWPNLLDKSYIGNSRFWNHEWKTHGQGFGYSQDPHFGQARLFRFTPNDYFRLAIRCKQNLDGIIGGDLAQYLKGIGFGPGATAEYGNQLIPKKISEKIQFIVEIRCNMADNKFQLLEIYICFTVTGRLRHCNYDYNSNHYIAWNCGRGRIKFPATRNDDEL